MFWKKVLECLDYEYGTHHPRTTGPATWF